MNVEKNRKRFFHLSTRSSHFRKSFRPKQQSRYVRSFPDLIRRELFMSFNQTLKLSRQWQDNDINNIYDTPISILKSKLPQTVAHDYSRHDVICKTHFHSSQARKSLFLLRTKGSFSNPFHVARRFFFRFVIHGYGKFSIKSSQIIKSVWTFSDVLASPTHPLLLFELHNRINLNDTPTNFHREFSLCFQTPTQTIVFVFLGSIALLSSAHADESSDISLHNDGTLDETSVVKNWTLVCEHLCRWAWKQIAF